MGGGRRRIWALEDEMNPRIVLVHAYAPSMPPILEAFADLWPEADVMNLLDECLYADVTPEGVMKDGLTERVATLLNHAVASGADGVIFTGSTFGAAVEIARCDIGVPVLKADEAMAEFAVERQGSILLVCTAGRAVPIIRANIESAAGDRPVAFDALVVADAKAALVAGDKARHDRLVAEAIEAHAPADTIALGQMSMAGVAPRLPRQLQQKCLISSHCSVEWMKRRSDPRQ